MLIVGHQKILNFLDRSIEKNALSQAYLFTGPEHVGKFTVARYFAEKITGGEGEKINPDIIVVSPEIEDKKGIIKKKDIPIEAVRDLRKDLSLSPYFGKLKVAIIDDADRMTVAAQNALLKTLEEPDERCILILIASGQGRVLPTIRSRCLVKRFGLVDDAGIRPILPDCPEREEMIFWSLGRPGLAVNFRDEPDSLLARKEKVEELEKMASGNINEKFSLAEKTAKDMPELMKKLEIWSVVLRECLLDTGRFHIMTPAKALETVEELGKSVKILRETNANARLALENLLLFF